MHHKYINIWRRFLHKQDFQERITILTYAKSWNKRNDEF